MKGWQRDAHVETWDLDARVLLTSPGEPWEDGDPKTRKQ